MVWSKNQITPIVATAKLGLYKQLKVYETVQNLVNIDQFWESDEFRDCLFREGGGAILSLDYDYWEEKFSSFLSDNPNSRTANEFLYLVDLYLESQPFSELCKRFLVHLSDENVLQFLQELHNTLTARMLRPPNNISFRILSLKFPDLQSLYLLNAILSYTSSTFSLILELDPSFSEKCPASKYQFEEKLKESHLSNCSLTFKFVNRNSQTTPCHVKLFKTREWSNLTTDAEYIEILKQVGIIAYYLLLELKETINNHPENIQKYFEYFLIDYEPIYYDEITFGKKKRKRKDSSSYSKQVKHSFSDSIQTVGCTIADTYKLPIIGENEESYFHYSKLDIPCYIINYFIEKNVKTLLKSRAKE